MSSLCGYHMQLPKIIINFGAHIQIPLPLKYLEIAITNPDPIGWVLDYRVGGRGFEPRQEQHLGSLNNWGESAAFVMTSANG